MVLRAGRRPRRAAPGQVLPALWQVAGRVGAQGIALRGLARELKTSGSGAPRRSSPETPANRLPGSIRPSPQDEPMDKSRRAGFTLIELMVTPAVAAILMAVAIPNLR